MIPQIDNSIDDTNLINEVILPSRTYKLSSNYETQIKYGDTQNVVGENIMLTDAAEVKLKKLYIKGNTKQDTTTGKNLLGKEWEYGDIIGGVNANDGATNRIRTKDYVEIEPDTTYTLSFQDTDIDFIRANIYLFNESKEVDEEALALYYDVDNNTKTFTTASTDHYLRFTARRSR